MRDSGEQQSILAVELVGDSLPKSVSTAPLARKWLLTLSALVVGVVVISLPVTSWHGLRAGSAFMQMFSIQCDVIAERILKYNSGTQFHSLSSFKYWDTITFLNSIGAFKPDCKANLGLELDATMSIVAAADRFRSLLGKEAQHLKDSDLPYAQGLEWPLRSFQSVNRPLSYDPILRSLARNDKDQDIPWWITTNAAGALTAVTMLQEPLRQLASADHSIALCDAGSGSGFMVAMLAQMSPPDATVIGIEHDVDVAEQSQVFLRSKALFDGNLVGGKQRAAALVDKIQVYAGNAISMTLEKLSGCKERESWACQDGEMTVPAASFDIVNVGFGLTPPFPKRLLDTVRTGGYLLVPTCYAHGKSGYCKEYMTVYRKLGNGTIVNATAIKTVVAVPHVQGNFVEVSG